MRIKTFGYFIREAFTSLHRNSWMVLASVGTVAVSLVIVGVSMITVINTNYLANRLESNVQIVAYVKTEVTSEDAAALKEKIQQIPGVAGLSFISKDQALNEFRRELGDQENMINALGGTNPLPDLFKVTTVSPQDVDKVAGKLQSFKEMEKVDYGKGVVEKLFSITRWVRWVGVTVIVLLGLAAVFLIATTIRLTVFARKKEIQIMKVLGATDWFVRWPFLLEGMALGFSGAILAVLIVIASYSALINYVQKELNFNIINLQTDPQFMMILGAALIGAGMLIGAVGSGVSMRKFLKV